MSRSVMAIDITVSYVSMCRLPETGDLTLRGVEMEEVVKGTKRSLAYENKRHVQLAQRVAKGIVKGGVPELVVLARPTFGAGADSRGGATKANDTTAYRRLGIFWALISELDAAGISVGELGVLSAAKALTRSGHQKTAARDLAAKARELYPDMTVPEDPRYRVSTVGLAVCAAIAVGIPTQVPPSEFINARLRAGGDFPETVRIPSAPKSAEAEQADKKRRSDFIEKRKDEITTGKWADLDKSLEPKNPELKALWRKRLAREKDFILSAPMSELEGRKCPQNLELAAVWKQRKAQEEEKGLR